MSELEELTAPAVHCRRCGHGFPAHGDGGGHCRGRVAGWGAVERDLRCMCPGFRWIDAAAAPVDYSSPPEPSAP